MKPYRLPALFLLLSVWVSPVLAGDPEILVARGIERIGLGDYQTAATLLTQALALIPDDPEANYYAGVALTRMSRYEEALPLLTRTLELDPNALDAYFELGFLHYHASRCPEAAKNLLRYQKGATDPEMIAAATEMLEACGEAPSEEEEAAWYRVQAVLGANYDTNVTLEPNNPPGEKDRKSDVRAVAFLSGGVTPYRHRLGNANLDGTFYQSLHAEQNLYNLTYTEIKPNVDLFLREQVVANLGYAYEFNLLDGDTYGRTHKVNVALTVQETGELSTDLKYTYRDQTYLDTGPFVTNHLRSGDRHRVLVRQNIAWRDTVFTLKGDGSFERADADHWSYDGFTLGLEASRKIVMVQASLELAYSQSHYKGADPGEGKKRRDNTQEYTFMVSYPFLDRFALTLSNTTYINDSNIPSLFEYTRNITGLYISVGMP